eukprot:12904329-Prorocentrum_lima.AAC.1
MDASMRVGTSCSGRRGTSSCCSVHACMRRAAMNSLQWAGERHVPTRELAGVGHAEQQSH